MNAFLYQPGQREQIYSAEGFHPTTANVTQMARAARALECIPEMVDILASTPEYTVYTIFDHEGDPNLAATEAVAELTGIEFNLDDEDQVLSGPVLIIAE
ncbi:hypothetical protein J0X19_11630 [Hymenobacter sp. BT186]|uniref:Uncharacterized protein n=1 Tax=Hymenobacter telluris TaxID=2816474 RepID=A0A939EZ87_9BACT|nr:hypothetical protein [Hymenobacter telluris]MBO0358598.1 hypothetical protein [Hymenobacter telluris]MBW3374624.1 hypothetical protein [Hymenobacter norwichensis]